MQPSLHNLVFMHLAPTMSPRGIIQYQLLYCNTKKKTILSFLFCHMALLPSHHINAAFLHINWSRQPNFSSVFDAFCLTLMIHVFAHHWQPQPTVSTKFQQHGPNINGFDHMAMALTKDPWQLSLVFNKSSQLYHMSMALTAFQQIQLNFNGFDCISNGLDWIPNNSRFWQTAADFDWVATGIDE